MVTKLTSEEKAIVEFYEDDGWESVLSEDNRATYKAAAQATFKKDKRVNIRISG